MYWHKKALGIPLVIFPDFSFYQFPLDAGFPVRIPSDIHTKISSGILARISQPILTVISLVNALRSPQSISGGCPEGIAWWIPAKLPAPFLKQSLLEFLNNYKVDLQLKLQGKFKGKFLKESQ